jgi:hypothetical protein
LRVDTGPEGDDEERAQLSIRLRDELQSLDVCSVSLARGGSAPWGAKGDPFTWGSLLVGISSGSLPALISAVSSWLSRQKQGREVSVKLGDDSLMLTGVSSEDQQRIVEQWLARHRDEKTGDE